MRYAYAVIGVLCAVLVTPTFADEQQESAAQKLPGVPLTKVLDAVSKQSGKVFAFEQSVDHNIAIGQIELRDMDYGSLLVVLSNNNLAAVEKDGIVNIVHVNRIRQFPLPVLYEEDDSVHGEQWVTMVVTVENANAKQLVPILRPMIPQQGHMVAHTESKTITFVDRYANVKRLLALIKHMDGESKQP